MDEYGWWFTQKIPEMMMHRRKLGGYWDKNLWNPNGEDFTGIFSKFYHQCYSFFFSYRISRHTQDNYWIAVICDIVAKQKRYTHTINSDTFLKRQVYLLVFLFGRMTKISEITASQKNSFEGFDTQYITMTTWSNNSDTNAVSRWKTLARKIENVWVNTKQIHI